MNSNTIPRIGWAFPVVLAWLMAPPVLAQCVPGQMLGAPTGYATGAYPLAVVHADFNADGIPDLAVANYNAGTVSVLVGQGDGSFRTGVAYPAGVSCRCLTAADVNADGFLDLAVGSLSQATIGVLLGSGDGTFGAPLYSSSGVSNRDLVARDFNGDGRLDLAVAGNASLVVLDGVGNGRFGAPRTVSAASSWAVVSGDFDGDGIADLASVGYYSTQITILLGNGSNGVGDGTFRSGTPVAVPSGAMSVVAADFDGNGFLDLAVGAEERLVVTLGQGNGSFLPVLNAPFTKFNALTVADVDRDGLPDLLGSLPNVSAVGLFMNRSGGAFDPPDLYPTGSGPVGLGAADLDGDRQPDLFVTESGANRVSVRRGLCGPPRVTAFNPTRGAEGDTVEVLGLNLGGADKVQLGGMTTVPFQVTDVSLRARVPAGAVTGPITVVTPRGEASSTDSFVVGWRPLILAAEPASAKPGVAVTIHGAHFTGATTVRFGDAGGAPFTVAGDSALVATVDLAATTGPIRVTNAFGTGASAFSFTVLPPDSAPTLVRVRDVPADQGGWVSVLWLRSDLDVPGARVITGYRVWRRAPLTAGTVRVAPSLASFDGARHVGALRPAGTSVEFWEPLATLPAAALAGYAYTAPTTRDSTADGNPYSAFFVQALTADPFLYYASAVDSGYSVDNLAPPAPLPFVVVYSSTGATLHWEPSRASDAREFRLYRGPGPDFDPDPAHRILTTRDTAYVDASPEASSWYRLAAVDLHGNEGRYAIVAPDHGSATLATVLGKETDGREARLRWYVSSDAAMTCTVYRSVAGGPWSPLAARVPDGTGQVRYVDEAVEPGMRYGYRLGVREEGAAEVIAGEAWIELPGPTGAIAAFLPNPIVAGDLRVSFAVPAAREVAVDLLDVTGRLIARRMASGSGRHEVTLARAADLAPGLYLVRIGLAPPVTLRTVVLR